MRKARLQSDNEINNIRRVDAIKELIASKDLINIDEYSIEIKGPEWGWLEIYIKKENEKPYLLELADTNNPLQDIRKWLEHLAWCYNYPSESRVIDCDTHEVLLSYDYLGYIYPNSISELVTLIQISDDIEEKDRNGDYASYLQMVVPVKKLVKDLYCAIKNHINANEKLYLEHWDLPGGQLEDINELREVVVSDIIEDYIKK